MSLVFPKGLLEMSYGLGESSGAPIGGALYSAAGFTYPFTVVGTATVMVGVLAWFVLPKPSKINRDDGVEFTHKDLGFFNFFSHPDYFFCTFSNLTVEMCITAVGATFELFVQDVEWLDNWEVGLLISIPNFFFAVSSPIFGYLFTRSGCNRVVIIIMQVIIGISMIFMGPMPSLPIQRGMPLLITCLIALGCASGAASPVSFVHMTDVAKRGSKNLTLATSATVSSWYLMAWGFGGFIGPTLAGILHNPLGTEWTYALFGFVCIGFALIYGVLLCVKRTLRCGNEEDWEY